MELTRIAFLPLVRTTFDVPLAEEMISKAREALIASGFSLTGPDRAITDIQAAEEAAQNLKGQTVDLILVFQATFADSTMVVALTEDVDIPVFLWALPEPWTGGRLRLNSLCGINLAGHALTIRGRKYEYAYGAPDDQTVIRKIQIIAAAERLRRQLKSVQLGLVGEHPTGLDSCALDAKVLETSFGIQVKKIQLDEVFTRARATSPEVIDQIHSKLDAKVENLNELEQKPLRGTLSVYSALKDISSGEDLDGLAVRCWPEFFTELGCAACGAMSLLSDGFDGARPIPCSCEADINGTVTQMMLQLLAGSPAFGTDMVGVDREKNTVALWHCGLAPMSMADPGKPIKGGIHSNRKLPLVMDFVLKPGEVTFARVSMATGKPRIVMGRGEIVDEPKPFSGTSGTLKLDITGTQFLDYLMLEGLEHHISFVYGDHLEVLEAFAKLAEIPILRLSLGGER